MKNLPTILASTWDNGLFVIDDGSLSHDFPNQTVRGLADDSAGGVLASVDGNALFKRNTQGEWGLLARCDHPISDIFSMDGKIFVGTDNAQVLVLDEGQEFQRIDNFDQIDGRDSWLAGTAIVDGKEVGPPLGVRSLHGASNGLLYANVHVGGIPRSSDSGATWAPTIDVELDAHQVCVDSNNTDLVVAATAEGLCISHDGGQQWSVHTKGLHDNYCSAVEIVGRTIFVAASEGHFTSQGAIYRRSIERNSEPLVKVTDGLPNWLEGIVDTSCICSKDHWVVLISAAGSIYVSDNQGINWIKRDELIPRVSSVYVY